MVVLKIIGKILLVPVWILVAISWLLIKVIVAVYSFARGFVALGLGALILGTVICYQDWKQVVFLIFVSGVMILVLIAGTFMEVLLESARTGIGRVLFCR